MYFDMGCVLLKKVTGFREIAGLPENRLFGLLGENVNM
jgi:hypothetical protein